MGVWSLTTKGWQIARENSGIQLTQPPLCISWIGWAWHLKTGGKLGQCDLASHPLGLVCLIIDPKAEQHRPSAIGPTYQPEGSATDVQGAAVWIWIDGEIRAVES